MVARATRNWQGPSARRVGLPPCSTTKRDARLDPPVHRPHARVPRVEPTPRRSVSRMVGNLEGSWQVWAHDRSDGVLATAERRTHWGGVGLGAARRAGGLVARHDRRRARLAGRGRVRRRNARPGLPGGARGLADRVVVRGGQERARASRSTGHTASIVVEADGATREIASFLEPAGVGSIEPGAGGGLSADGSLLCIWHSEHGDILHASLRVLDVATGAAVGDIAGRGSLPATRRLVARPRRSAAGVHERARRLRAAGDLGPRHRRRDRTIAVDLPGAVFPVRVVARRLGAARASRARGARAAAPARPGDAARARR